ncbi:MAG: hypothetical protein C5B56_13170 [Proteobacteria bacterium]|nr:MAG: hypothetical protein C5B56_13170 [Pseudomonadota bacterium]
MGETPDELKYEIEQARARLGQDLNQLEYRVRTELDWRLQFDRRPWLFVGVAFGAAFLLALALGPRRGRVMAPRADR